MLPYIVGALMCAGVAAFFIFGGFYSWLLSVPVRNERYFQAKKIKELTQKIAELEAEKHD